MANDHLKVAWYNCAGGLLAKIEDIKILVKLYDLDIFFVTESEIKTDSNVGLFKIPGYELNIADTLHSLGHARSEVFTRNDINCKVVVAPTEVIKVVINDMTIAGVYRQFKLWPGQTHCGELIKIIECLKSI